MFLTVWLADTVLAGKVFDQMNQQVSNDQVRWNVDLERLLHLYSSNLVHNLLQLRRTKFLQHNITFNTSSRCRSMNVICRGGTKLSFFTCNTSSRGRSIKVISLSMKSRTRKKLLTSTIFSRWTGNTIVFSFSSF